jgi:hypothetical protein
VWSSTTHELIVIVVVVLAQFARGMIEEKTKTRPGTSRMRVHERILCGLERFQVDFVRLCFGGLETCRRYLRLVKIPKPEEIPCPKSFSLKRAGPTLRRSWVAVRTCVGRPHRGHIARSEFVSSVCATDAGSDRYATALSDRCAYGGDPTCERLPIVIQARNGQAREATPDWPRRSERMNDKTASAVRIRTLLSQIHTSRMA